MKRVFSLSIPILFFSFKPLSPVIVLRYLQKKLAELEEKIERLQLLPFEKEKAVLKDGYSTSITSINYFYLGRPGIDTAIGALRGVIGFKILQRSRKLIRMN